MLKIPILCNLPKPTAGASDQIIKVEKLEGRIYPRKTPIEEEGKKKRNRRGIHKT